MKKSNPKQAKGGKVGTFFDLDPDPFLKIQGEKNKLFIKDLEKVGLDREKIKAILSKQYGLKWQIPLGKGKNFQENQKNYRAYSYAIRKLMVAGNDELVSESVKETLAKELTRLYNEREEFKNIPFYDFKLPGIPGEKEAKSWKQNIGFQVVELFNYIEPFSNKINDARRIVKPAYFQRHIFELIAELLNNFQNSSFKHKNIETLYFNNI